MSQHILIKKTADVTCSPDILKSLGLDTLFALRDDSILEYLTCDMDILACRSRIFRDTLKVPSLLPLLDEVVRRLSDIQEILRLQGRTSEADRGLYALRQLECYFEIVDSMAAFCHANQESLTSPEYLDLFCDMAAEAASDEYTALRRNTETMVEQIRNVKSITVGFNIDAALTPYEAGLISINDGYIESGNMIDRILRLDGQRHTDDLSARRSMVPLVPARSSCTADEYAALTNAAYTALNKIFKKQVRRIEPEIHRYMKNHLNFLLDLLPDLRFICELTRIQKRLSAAKIPLCMPEFCPKEERRFTAEGLFEPVLALHKFENNEAGHVVSNDLSFDEEGGIFLLTGPNSGGKTVFLKSVGIAQIMAQTGMMVPARHLVISPVTHLYVEFPRYTTSERAGGRLEYECAEIRSIFSNIDPHSLVLLDEAFSSTAPDEAIALALEVLKAMSMMGVRGIYISHYHLLTTYLQDLNRRHTDGLRFDFLAAEMADDQNRSYRITRRSPDGNSYADSIAERYGISADRLASMSCPRNHS